MSFLLELKLFIDMFNFLLDFLYWLLHLEKKYMKVSTSVHFLGNLYRGIYWILWSDIVKFCTTIFFYITQYTCMHIKCIVKIKGHFFKLHFRVKWCVNQMDKVLLYSSVFYWLFKIFIFFLILKQIFIFLNFKTVTVYNF